jgi:hypothetical protein
MEHRKTIYILIGLAVLVGLVFFYSSSYYKSTADEAKSSNSTLGTISNLQKGTAPWPAEFTHLRERLASIGLPALAAEGTALHIHQHLDISVNGVAVAVPAGIGIDPNGQFISAIHVHDTSGIVHVESPTVQTFTLGQFFDIWGLTFTQQCIGGECSTDSNPSNTSGQALQVYLNGTLYSGDPRSIALAAHQEIYIFYGTAAQLPKTIPRSFAFPAGY